MNPGARQWGAVQVIPDEADDYIVDALRDGAVTDWHRLAAEQGYRPEGEPGVVMQRSIIPIYFTDPETGEEIKQPDRAWSVRGWVVPVDAKTLDR